MPGNPHEDTYCPNCGEVVIDRSGFDIEKWNLTDDMRCAGCENKIFMVGSKPRHFRHREITALC